MVSGCPGAGAGACQLTMCMSPVMTPPVARRAWMPVTAIWSCVTWAMASAVMPPALTVPVRYSAATDAGVAIDDKLLAGAVSGGFELRGAACQTRRAGKSTNLERVDGALHGELPLRSGEVIEVPEARRTVFWLLP